MKAIRIINKESLYLGYGEDDVDHIELLLSNEINSITGVQYTYMIEVDSTTQLEFQFVCMNLNEYLYRYITWHNIKN